MQYQGVSESDIKVALKCSVYEMKQLVAFISEHLPDDSMKAVNYNFYTIERHKRELTDSIARVKEELTTL